MFRLAFAEKKQAFDDLLIDVKRVNEEFQHSRKAAQELQQRANKEAPLHDEDGNDLPLRAELESLGVETLDQVEVAMEEAEQKANSIDANPDAIRQFEARKKEIEQLEVQLEQMVQDKEDKTAQLDRNRKRWEDSLHDRIVETNSLFSKYMSEMGTTGELELYKGEPDENGNHGSFKDWGIKIHVSFREGTKAQPLSATLHSGGERSVSTIMFLMAAQGMLVSPFRCVGT